MKLLPKWFKPKRMMLPALLLATAAVPALSPTPASADVPNPNGGYTLYYADEFTENAINENDWMYRDAGPYSKGYNKKENVRESEGVLHIDMKKEQINSQWYYTGGGIVTKKVFGYGYYETKAKLFNATTGLHPAFWSMGLSNHLTSNNITALSAEIAAGNLPYYNQVTEIDGFEANSADPTLNIGTVTHIPGFAGPRKGFNVQTPDSWHVYGYDWSPTAIKFYVDGTLVHMIDLATTPQPFSPANFWLTALVGDIVADDSKLPGDTQFDYFRYYTKNYSGANMIGNAAMEYTPKDTTRGYTDQDTPSWIETGDKTASFMTTQDAHSGVRSLKHASSSSYQVTTKQNLNGIANGTYQLSAWVKSSGGQAQARMSVSNDGGTEQYVDIPAASIWTQVTLDNVQVTNGQATVAFTSNADSTQWLFVDDVSFSDVLTPPEKEFVHEAEILPTTVSTGDTQANYKDSITGASFNGLASNGIGDFVEYTVNVPQPGTYTVYARNRVAPSKGMYQLSVNGTNLGSTVDQYATTAGFTESKIGTVTFGTTGSQAFRFTVTGKNAASSSYALAYDSIKLVKNDYEFESVPVSVSTGDSQSNYTDTAAGVTFNNLTSNAIGDYVDYTLNVLQPGTYTVYVGSRVAANKGIYQLSVNGTNLGSPIDQYAAASGYAGRSLGTVTFSAAGNHTFRFTVAGKNAASSRYDLGFDNISLVKNKK
ncbi:family 16 glycosylhydrolase [Paenibacillus alba]|uniref:glycoside hydrolase family 16 protein n=1 Tax=Paenibacillus alba TaxID=1197127 RepID=UPI001565F316|nr:glycoside hydrolase family 16 protein [Paenibacillus alba]NQX65942.1 family 16 glycosylhydrolase [Paenibacillus alba]